MSGDILQTPDAPKPQGALDNYFKITARGSTGSSGSTGWLNDLSGHGLFRYRRSGNAGQSRFSSRSCVCCHLSGRGLRLVADGIMGQFANGDWLRDFLDGVYRIQSGTRATN